ncbi:hypothetical protein N7533_000794 [Penicillium manginii]|uniref:uncharacterized protein n=1 Tax=Penicillium manginii TaxID=203109 RepID=UPI00254977AB|nr:uncharacterized protein N7533_000794 [Penicillium manginii]KAJ5768211.1 hypothetical protein N7533_000794 [Penicillium manginii]
MTTAVLAPPSTRIERREPLATIGMAASQAQSRASASGKTRAPRRSTRNSANQQGLEEIANESKRKAGYEDDEGFQFARVPSKKSKPTSTMELVPENPASDLENTPVQSTPRRGRPPKKRAGESATAATAKRKSTELPTRRPVKGAMSSEPDHREQPEQKKKKPGRPSKSKTADTNGFRSPEPTKVALPVADTPVIQRNKELRGKKSGKGRRRISSEMRGRRASSLIDSGASNALPHREVRTADFYKHIADEGLSEPRRMRQLLIWCATRALGDKPSSFHQEDQSAHLAARVIQEDLQKEFSSNSNLSDWFSREELHPASVVVKKPNPRNIQNTEKIKELEEQILKLQKERHALNALLKQPPIPRIDTESNPPTKSPRRIPAKKSIYLSSTPPNKPSTNFSIPPESSTEEESSTSSKPRPSSISPADISARLSRITTGLAPTLDALAAGLHDIELYRSTADTFSSQVLRICAQRLEERDAQNMQKHLAIEGEDIETQSSSRVAPSQPRPRQDLGLILGALSRVERR